MKLDFGFDLRRVSGSSTSSDLSYRVQMWTDKGVEVKLPNGTPCKALSTTGWWSRCHTSVTYTGLSAGTYYVGVYITKQNKHATFDVDDIFVVWNVNGAANAFRTV